MKNVGIIAWVAGALFGLYGLSMDVSVQVDYSSGNSYGFPDRVNNLGLMSQRQNYLIISGVLLLAGTLIIALRNKSDGKTKHKFKEFHEIAKRAEYKERFSVAIENYTDALYHLENDYSEKYMSKSDNESRKKLIKSIKEKVEELTNLLPKTEKQDI